MRRHRNNSALKMQNVLLNSSKYGRSASNTPPYALHGLLLAICARRAGIPSKTDHRVRKLTYTHTHTLLQPGWKRGPHKGNAKGEVLLLLYAYVILGMCMILTVLFGKACLAWPPCPSYSHNFSMLCLAEYIKGLVKRTHDILFLFLLLLLLRGTIVPSFGCW